MISFEPTQDKRLISETVLEFAKTTLAPRAREFEQAGAVAADVRRAVQEMQLALAAFPEEYGGQGLGLITAVAINEELALGDPAAAFGLPGFGAFALAAAELGSAEQAQRLLAPFADTESAGYYGAVAWSEPQINRERAGFCCVAKVNATGFVLSGVKAFVGNAGHAEQFIVFAQLDEPAGWGGIAAFVVPRGSAGLSVGARHRTLGLDCADFRTVTLDGVEVPAASRLLGGDDFTRACARFFAKYSLMVAARQVGLSRAAFEIAREYCDIRQAFGKPIGHFQAVAFTLADRHMDGESAAALCRRAAWAWDSGQPERECLLYTAQAVANAHEGAMRCADDAVQLHGGAGFMRDVIVEKMMRDAKQIALSGMTAEQMDQLAADLEVRRASERWDPALVLPTPETQAIFT